MQWDSCGTLWGQRREVQWDSGGDWGMLSRASVGSWGSWGFGAERYWYAERGLCRIPLRGLVGALDGGSVALGRYTMIPKQPTGQYPRYDPTEVFLTKSKVEIQSMTFVQQKKMLMMLFMERNSPSSPLIFSTTTRAQHRR